MRRLKIYFTVYFDSSPSCDDSHGAVDDMPKEEGFKSPYPFGIFPFLMSSSALEYIRHRTYEKCDLYLVPLLVII